MKNTNQNTRGSNSTANRCTSQRPDRPASRGGSPSIEYADLFGTAALAEESDPAPSRAEEDPGEPEGDPERETPEYNDLFGTAGLDSDPGTSADTPEREGAQERAPEPPNEEPAGDPSRARDPFASNCGDPPAAPALPFTAQPAQRAVYQEAFRAAYRYPDPLMLVMQGIRKGLKRGQEAGQREENRAP